MINAEEILRYRKTQNLTQEELANQLGVSIRTIQNYESGGKIPASKMRFFEIILNAERLNTENEPEPLTELEEKFKGISIEEVCLYVVNHIQDCLKIPTFKLLIDNISSKKALKILREL